ECPALLVRGVHAAEDPVAPAPRRGQQERRGDEGAGLVRRVIAREGAELRMALEVAHEDGPRVAQDLSGDALARALADPAEVVADPDARAQDELVRRRV